MFSRSLALLSVFAAGTMLAQTGEPAAPATPPAREFFHIYLLMGQSNMAGRDRRTLDAQSDDPRILALHADGRWLVARDPLHPQRGRTLPGIGLGIPFAREMLKTADPKITIGLVPCAVGGSSLRRWIKGAEYYEQTVSRARLAAQAGLIKGVLWHQGESDTTSRENAGTYETRLARMLQDLRNDLGRPDLPIMVGQIGEFLLPEKYPFADTVRGAIRRIPDIVPRVGFADSAGLGDLGDKLHFSADAQQQMGARFAKAMRVFQKQ
ncbi:sialate O-acetylesterase [Termitidicoccus mucosus]